jgi:hypothetical protein
VIMQQVLTVPPGIDDQEFLFASGLTDGLPVVPPTQARVSSMLSTGPWTSSTILMHEPVTKLDVTAEQVAICAVLAGATPSAFRVIGSAVQALGDPDFMLHGVTASTGGAAIMIVVCGPAASQAGVHGGEGLFGPGFRANATIGRAIRLVIMHCLTATPGQGDRSTQGWPGKFTLCFCENTIASPWQPIHTTYGYQSQDSAVVLFAAASGQIITNHGARTQASLLLTVADTMAGLGSFSPGRSVVVFCPEHAATLASLSRDYIQTFLYEHAIRDLATLKEAGKIEADSEPECNWTGDWAPKGDPKRREGDDSIFLHRGWSPADILLLVGGGLAGGHSTFFPSFSRSRSVPFVIREIPPCQ